MTSINEHDNTDAFKFINETCDDVVNICSPLFQKFSFNQFSYMKFYDDGKIFRLVGNKEWSKKFLEFGFYNDNNLFHNQILNMKEGNVKYIILHGEPEGNHQEALYNSDIWNVAIRYKREKKFVESWAFGTSRDNTQAINIYLNEFDLLCQFVSYFKEKAAYLINMDDPRKLLASSTPSISNSTHTSFTEKDFINQLCIKKFWLDKNDELICFTKREIEILTYLANGKSLKETSFLLNISPRTVETHIIKIKCKLECFSKSEMLDKFLQYL